LSLSVAQQEYVLSNKRLLHEFQSLARDFAIARQKCRIGCVEGIRKSDFADQSLCLAI
jgi:hypothetical protein